jgi:Tol biopolymer transport system component
VHRRYRRSITTLIAVGALCALAIVILHAAKPRGALFVVDASGGKSKRIVAHCIEGFAWSPDGKSIAYSRLVRDNASDDLGEVVTVRNGARRRLGEGGRGEPPGWSPDSTRVAYSGGNAIVAVPLAGTAKPVELNAVPGEPDSWFVAYSPAWSPNGELVAFSAGDQQVAVVKADGSDFRFITAKEVAGLAVPVHWLDSNRLLFVGGGPGNGAGPLMEVGVAGGDVHQITPANSWVELFSISPDGRRIAYTDGQTYELYVVNVDGSHFRRIAHGLVGDNAWSPNGKRIVFEGDDGLDVINVDGTGKRRLASNVGGDGIAFLSASWSSRNQIAYIADAGSCGGSS